MEQEDALDYGPWVYEMQELGYNYRISDLQCALGRSQLKQVDQFVERRREIVAQYNEAFESVEWIQVPDLQTASSDSDLILDPDSIAWHLYSVQIDFDQIGKSRAEVMDELRERDRHAGPVCPGLPAALVSKDLWIRSGEVPDGGGALCVFAQSPALPADER